MNCERVTSRVCLPNGAFPPGAFEARLVTWLLYEGKRRKQRKPHWATLVYSCWMAAISCIHFSVSDLPNAGRFIGKAEGSGHSTQG